MSTNLTLEAFNQINWNNLLRKNTKMLNKCKILQRNVIFVTGIPKYLEDDDVLKTSSYFGQYGIVSNITINKTIIKKGLTHDPDTFAAYITFADVFSACFAYISLLTCNVPDMPTLKVSFATTKYCKYFMKNSACELANCSFAHSPCYFEDLIEMEKYTSSQMQDLFKNIAIKYIRANKARLYAIGCTFSQTSVVPTLDDCAILKEILVEPIEIEENFNNIYDQNINMSNSCNSSYYRPRARTAEQPKNFVKNCGTVQSAGSLRKEVAWNNIPEAHQENYNSGAVGSFMNQKLFNKLDNETSTLASIGNSWETLYKDTDSEMERRVYTKMSSNILNNKKICSDAFDIYKQSIISKELNEH